MQREGSTERGGVARPCARSWASGAVIKGGLPDFLGSFVFSCRLLCVMVSVHWSASRVQTKSCRRDAEDALSDRIHTQARLTGEHLKRLEAEARDVLQVISAGSTLNGMECEDSNIQTQ